MSDLDDFQFQVAVALVVFSTAPKNQSREEFAAQLHSEAVNLLELFIRPIDTMEAQLAESLTGYLIKQEEEDKFIWLESLRPALGDRKFRAYEEENRQPTICEKFDERAESFLMQVATAEWTGSQMVEAMELISRDIALVVFSPNFVKDTVMEDRMGQVVEMFIKLDRQKFPVSFALEEFVEILIGGIATGNDDIGVGSHETAERLLTLLMEGKGNLLGFAVTDAIFYVSTHIRSATSKPSGYRLANVMKLLEFAAYWILCRGIPYQLRIECQARVEAAIRGNSHLLVHLQLKKLQKLLR